MAKIAISAVVGISGDTDVIGVASTLIVFVTGKTGEVIEASRISMAGIAVIPLAAMVARKNRKESIVVNQISRFP